MRHITARVIVFEPAIKLLQRKKQSQVYKIGRKFHLRDLISSVEEIERHKTTKSREKKRELFLKFRKNGQSIFFLIISYGIKIINMNGYVSSE